MCLSITPVTVFADGFKLRNDIHFGDNLEDVKAKETLKLKELETDEEDSSLTYIASEPGMIANIDNSSVVYCFKDGLLYEMKYHFGKKTTESNTAFEVEEMRSYVKDQCKTLSDSLTRKYGEPLYIEDGKAFDFRTDIWEPSDDYEWLASMGVNCELLIMEERFFECDDGSHVTIDLKGAYIGNEKGMVSRLSMAYMQVSEDQWNNAVNAVIEKQNNLDNDL